MCEIQKAQGVSKPLWKNGAQQTEKYYITLYTTFPSKVGIDA